MKNTRAIKSNDSHAQGSVYNPEFLLEQARWIRDDLDPQVARDGPDALHSDDILTLDSFLRRLLNSKVSLEDIRFSRLHMAIAAIAGKATRWPKKLIERSDQVMEAWEAQHGSLKGLGIPLYEPGGRLHGICKPDDLSKEKLIIKWLKAPGVKISPLLPRKIGDLGFTPGEHVFPELLRFVFIVDGVQSWWISPLFAFRAGIIDSAEHEGGIIADAKGAYAILMTDEEEVNGPSPELFTYRARSRDTGRYRLTSATRESRQPIRILRGHSLRSFWAPKAGVRYDGLHRIIGWAIRPDAKSKAMIFEIKFERLASELSMDIVLRRPFSDEVEDYKEFKRQRQMIRDKQEDAARAKAEASRPALTVSIDGTAEGDTAHMKPQCRFEDPIPEDVYYREPLSNMGRRDSMSGVMEVSEGEEA